MKTLRYRRHSIKDGLVKDTIGEKGIALAIAEGQKDGDNDIFPDHVFHGELVRTAQTALAYTYGLESGVKPMQVVPEIGSQTLFSELANDALRQAVSDGASNFEAVIKAHGVDVAKVYAANAADGVVAMLEACDDDDVAIAFGHSPIIELAAWALTGFGTLTDELSKLSDLEGIVFQMDDEGDVEVIGKIAVEK